MSKIKNLGKTDLEIAQNVRKFLEYAGLKPTIIRFVSENWLFRIPISNTWMVRVMNLKIRLRQEGEDSEIVVNQENDKSTLIHLLNHINYAENLNLRTEEIVDAYLNEKKT